MNDAFTDGLAHFLHQSRSMYHSTAAAAAELEQEGEFQRLNEADEWTLVPGQGYFVTRNDSSLLAFLVGEGRPAEVGFELSITHTDSPTFRLRHGSAAVAAGQLWMGLEPYGNPMYATWLDRDVGVAGRAVSFRDGQPVSRLLDSDRAVAIIPNLALHLHQQFNKGFEYNPHKHLHLLLGPRTQALAEGESLPQELRDMFQLAEDEIAELFVYHAQPPQELPGGLLASSRVDNLAMVYAQLSALLACSTAYNGGKTLVCCMVDSEEIGNLTYQGGQSDFIPRMLERIVLSQGGGREDLLRALARSFLVSMDGAQASHPCYPEVYDDRYPVWLGRGPCLKFSAGVSYATSRASASRVMEVARQQGIPLQWSAARADQKTGRTVGPPVAAALGVPAVDMGAGQLAMHSVRELVSISDVAQSARLLSHIFDDS